MLKTLFSILLIASLRSNGLINATQLSGKRDLVRITFSNSWVCTGTYVDPETILTAAHCINDIPQPTLSKIESVDDKVIDVTSKKVIASPLYRPNSKWDAHDIALIKTTENLEFAGDFKVREAHLPVIGRLRLYGCGKVDEKSRRRTYGENSYLRFSSSLIFLGWLGASTSIAPNDSGAPVLNIDSDEILAIAATSSYPQSLKLGLPIVSTANIIDSADFYFIRSHMRTPH